MTTLLAGVLFAAPSAATPPHDLPQQAQAPHQSASSDASDRKILASDNIEHVAHVPKQGPFSGYGAFGTDIAFRKNFAYVGNYKGFTVYNIGNPSKPKIMSQVVCPGGQNDVSIKGDLLFLSTDYPRSNNTCNSEPASSADPGSWQGIKIFDVSNPRKPSYVAAVPTSCGSHTHTLVPSKSGESVYLYVSSYGPSEQFPTCQPPHDKISIVEVPLKNPADAEVIDAPVLFPKGGNPGDSTTSRTSGCHDITVFPAKDLAAGACMGDGILMDISDRENPRVIDRVRDDENFAFWHSATFNNDGTKVVFTDELGGGGAATCNPEVGRKRGADGIYEIVGSGDNRHLEFRSYYKIPRQQADTENCVAHNGSLIPVEGRDIMVQAWYQGGVSVWEFTDSSNPHEIAYFDRTAFDTETLRIAGPWSAYYYNGYIYVSGIQEGLDVLKLHDPRTEDAADVKFKNFNPQTQPQY